MKRARMHVTVGALVGAVAIHVVLVACSARSSGGGAAASDAGFADIVDAMRTGDVGGALDAAVDALADATIDRLADLGRAETPDAIAGGGAPMEVACTVTGETRIAVSSTTVVTRSYYAVINTTLAGRDVPDLRAVTCDPVEDTNPCRAYLTSPGVGCTTSGVAVGPSTCTQASVIFEAGRILVPCGVVSDNISGSVTTTSGYHYRHAFVRGL